MEALAVLSVASAIAQFTDFTARLLSTSIEIYTNASGASADNMALEEVYSKVQELAGELGNATAQSTGTEAHPHDPRAQTASRLERIAADCKRDCDALLEILDQL